MQDELKLGYNTIQILEKRFLQRTNTGFESPKELFNRVADHINSVQETFNEKGLRNKFRKLLTDRKFCQVPPYCVTPALQHTVVQCVQSTDQRRCAKHIQVMSHAARIQREGQGQGSILVGCVLKVTWYTINQ